MEGVSRSGRKTTELHHLSRKWKDPRSAERSPERTRVWTEPNSNGNKPREVPVVYYLSRNGNLEHPHFIEVPLSSSDGLYLRDVIDRLDSLRGKGMAALYSWSSKRSYKNGFVWHDLSENDYIYPASGQEYILKGSELVVITGGTSPDFEKPGDDFPVVRRRRNQSWTAVDLHEYKVYTGKLAADASTQTDDKRRSELTRDEIISPPPSDSSPETLESLMKADGKLILKIETENGYKTNDTAGGSGSSSSNNNNNNNNNKIKTSFGGSGSSSSNNNNNKIKTSSVLMQLITCGSISFRDCGPGAYGKDNPGVSLISHYKCRMVPRGEATVEDAVVLRKNRRVKKHVVTEDKEYFSGSLIETKRVEFPAVVIKRSNSYNGDR